MRCAWRARGGEVGAEGSCSSAAPCGHRVSVREGSGLLLAPPPWLVPLLALARPALRQTGYTAPACTTHSAPSCRGGGGGAPGGRAASGVWDCCPPWPSPPPSRRRGGPETLEVLFLLR